MIIARYIGEDNRYGFEPGISYYLKAPDTTTQEWKIMLVDTSETKWRAYNSIEDVLREWKFEGLI